MEHVNHPPHRISTALWRDAFKGAVIHGVKEEEFREKRIALKTEQLLHLERGVGAC